VRLYSETNGLKGTSGDKTIFQIMIDYKGYSTKLANPSGGTHDVQRTIEELFQMEVRFTNVVTIVAPIVIVYSKVAVEVTLVSTTAQMSNTWAGANLNATGGSGIVTVDIVLQTKVVAPFVIDSPKASIDYDGAGGTAAYELVTPDWPVQVGALTDNCKGPYKTASSGSGVLAGTDVCTQTWDMQVDIALATRCSLSNAILRFWKDGGIKCGSAATDVICPLNGASQVVGTGQSNTDDDLEAVLTISTSSVCPSIGMTTLACGAVDTYASGTTNHKGAFTQNDQLKIDVQAGTETASSMELSSISAYIQTSGTGDCSGTACSNKYYIQPSDSTCSFTTPAGDAVSNCKRQCRSNLDITLNTNDYNISPNPSHDGATTTVTFQATILLFWKGYSVTNVQLGRPWPSTDAINKKSIDVSSDVHDMYALLQTEGDGEQLNVDTTIGFGGLSDVEVEEATAPETTEAVQQQMAVEESSSNLVYIVVGVLLVLSVGIAAVVMYMRRSKNAKKVVPVPITVEVRNTSSTN